MFNHNTARKFAVLLALAVTLTGLAATGFGQKKVIKEAPSGSESCPQECQELAMARAATARYHNVNNALADGFVPTGPCVSVPGLGAMGIHYANFSRLDGSVDAAEPELLLYLPDEGRLRLVGIEYYAPAGAVSEAPSLFGRTFQGPMPGHGPGEPVHYDLHVWLWRHNPAGLFAPFNPKLSCQ